MTDLRVDYAVLEASTSSLTRLRSEFDAIERRRDATSDLWGHEAVRDAMDEFASNMHHHREALSKEMGTVQEKLQGTISAFREADAKLAAELEENTTHQPPTGGSGR